MATDHSSGNRESIQLYIFQNTVVVSLVMVKSKNKYFYINEITESNSEIMLNSPITNY